MNTYFRYGLLILLGSLLIFLFFEPQVIFCGKEGIPNIMTDFSSHNTTNTTNTTHNTMIQKNAIQEVADTLARNYIAVSKECSAQAKSFGISPKSAAKYSTQCLQAYADSLRK